MKILAEEIVKRWPAESPDKGPGNRYERKQIGVLDFPAEMLAVMQEGHVFVIDNGGVENNRRRKLVIANVRMAILEDVDHVGLIVDLVDPGLYKAIEEDQNMPADYEAFCKLENVE